MNPMSPDDIDVVVGIPWRPGEGRHLAHAMTVDFYRRALPNAEIVEVDSHHEPYNLAAARNLAVHAIEQAQGVVGVIADADCLPPIDSLRLAVVGAHQHGWVHLPFTEQMYLTEQETVALALHGTEPTENRAGPGNGCCYVMRPETYWEFGGSDDRFSGWGGDDDQLVAAATCLVGLKRWPGRVLSLWHPAVRDVGSERHRPNAELAHRYWAAINDPDAMRALIKERET